MGENALYKPPMDVEARRTIDEELGKIRKSRKLKRFVTKQSTVQLEFREKVPF